MTSAGLRIYTTIIAIICGGAVAWSIHQASLASSWQAAAQRTVTHDRATARQMRHLVVRYNRLVLKTRRSERKLLASIRNAQTGGTQLPSAPGFATLSSPATSPAPVAAPAPAPPTTHTS